MSGQSIKQSVSCFDHYKVLTPVSFESFLAEAWNTLKKSKERSLSVVSLWCYSTCIHLMLLPLQDAYCTSCFHYSYSSTLTKPYISQHHCLCFEPEWTAPGKERVQEFSRESRSQGTEQKRTGERMKLREWQLMSQEQRDVEWKNGIWKKKEEMEKTLMGRRRLGWDWAKISRIWRRAQESQILAALCCPKCCS